MPLETCAVSSSICLAGSLPGHIEKVAKVYTTCCRSETKVIRQFFYLGYSTECDKQIRWLPRFDGRICMVIS